MISLSLLSLLTLMAYPHFNHLILRAHRLEAKTALWEAALHLENYYAIHQNYSGANLRELQINENSEKGYYRLELKTGTQNYRLEAIPQGTQSQDIECGIYSLNQTGIIEGAKGCW